MRATSGVGRAARHRRGCGGPGGSARAQPAKKTASESSHAINLRTRVAKSHHSGTNASDSDALHMYPELLKTLEIWLKFAWMVFGSQRFPPPKWPDRTWLKFAGMVFGSQRSLTISGAPLTKMCDPRVFSVLVTTDILWCTDVKSNLQGEF